MKEELASIERFRGPKERALAQCRSSLEAMQATKEGLESELHQVNIDTYIRHILKNQITLFFYNRKTGID